MCGIAGIAYSDGSSRVDREALVAMRDTMFSRGPDDAGLWLSADEQVGFAHRRLSIIDTSQASHQPMSSADDSVVIVFNGEIYNYQELRREHCKGYPFTSDGDTEVLLALYQRYGTGMFSYLRGMYAFAVWDIEKQTVLLARDPFGIKPLYYANTERGLYFASQVRALASLDEIPKELDSAAATGFFLLGSVPEPYTLIKEIRQLEAGHYMEWSPEKTHSIGAHFSITEQIARAASSSSARDVAAASSLESLHASLADSVRAHLISDVPIGFFLSAGYDSTALVGLAQTDTSASLHTVTLGFDTLRGSFEDETRLAESTARQYGTSHETVWVEQSDFVEQRKSLFAAMDQPSIDGVNTYFCAKAARDSGLTVALSGLGGDELFGGYAGFSQIPKLLRLGTAIPFRNSLGSILRAGLSPFIGTLTSPKYAGLLEYAGDVSSAYFLRRALYMPWELSTFVRPLTAQSSLQELSLHQRLAEDVIHAPNPWAALVSLELQWFMRNQLLRDSDWASMAHALEIRVPFVDVNVLSEVVSRLGATPYTKQDMIRCVTPTPADEILNRKKTGFTVPIREWLLGDFNQQGGDRTVSERSSEGFADHRGLRGWAHFVFREYCIQLGIDTEHYFVAGRKK